MVAPVLGMLCQIKRVAKSLRRIASFKDWRQIEDGIKNHLQFSPASLSSQRRMAFYACLSMAARGLPAVASGKPLLFEKLDVVDVEPLLAGGV